MLRLARPCRHFRKPCIAGALALAAACRPSGEVGQSDWRSQRDSIGDWATLDTEGVCENCIRIERVLTIGDEDGPGVHEGTSWAARDRNGRIWVANRGGPKIYDRSGDFVQQIGRPGQGPLEFQSSGPILLDANDQVYLFDRRNARRTVVDLAGTLKAESSLPGSIREVALLADGRFVANMRFPSAELVGYPLHILDGPDVVASFGLSPSGSIQVNTTLRVATGPDGLIYAARYYDYVIEAWTDQGDRVKGVRRAGLPRLPAHGQPQPLQRGVTPPTLVQAVHVDPEGLVWVAAWVAREDWEDQVKEVESPNGGTVLMPGSMSDVYYQLVEVIDMGSETVVGNARMDPLITGFWDGGWAFGDHIEDGTLGLFVWRVGLRPSRRP